MKAKQQEIIWISVVIAFYILTGFLGVYNIGLLIMWPIFAVPMSLLLIKTGQREIVGLVGVVLAVIISFLTTHTFHPVIISGYLLFILVPAFLFGGLYIKKTIIPHIIIVTTITVFLNGIIFLTFNRLLGVDYLELYFSGLDILQNIWNDYLMNPEIQQFSAEAEGVIQMYTQKIGLIILQAKRTYPATLFTFSLTGATIHLLIIQLIGRIRSWERPRMKEILNVGLSPVAAWVLVGLMIVGTNVGGVDTTWTFVAESMLVVLFTMFQIMGFISIIVMTMRLGTKGITRILLTVISIFWLIFNPTLLVIIGCLDSIFNFRKVKTLI